MIPYFALLYNASLNKGPPLLLFKRIGCFCDNYCGDKPEATTVRAISGKITFYTPSTAVTKCYEKAKAGGYSHFAVQYYQECFTSEDAGSTYDRFGRTTGCTSDGRGGSWKSTVYEIAGM